MTLRFTLSILLASLLAAPTALGGAADRTLDATVSTLPGAEEGSILVRLRLRNTGPTDLSLTLPRAAKQSCATAPHVRVLRAATREVVYPRGDEAALVLCLADTPTARLPAGSTLTFDRSVNLTPGRYVIEAYVPATPETPRVSAGYRVVTVR